MALFRLCDGDPIIDVLTDTFNANIVRIPEQRIQPLWIVGRHNSEMAARGSLASLVNAPLELPEVMSGSVASVSGRKTRSVDAHVGIAILEGFLAGMGLGQASSGIRAAFTDVKEVSFSFSDVQRHYVDTGELGRVLSGKRLDLRNPAAAIFSGADSWECFVIDSTITSTNFTIRIEKTESQKFQLALPEIQRLLSACGDLNATQVSALDVTFAGQARLAFAFTALRVEVHDDGQILRLPPARKGMFLSGRRSGERLVKENAMLDLPIFA